MINEYKSVGYVNYLFMERQRLIRHLCELLKIITVSKSEMDGKWIMTIVCEVAGSHF